jgi:coenzyme PQQ precursor peptide PqqA
MKTQKSTWTRPAFSLTSTGFEVTMYLNTPNASR